MSPLTVVYFTPDIAAVALVRELLAQDGLDVSVIPASTAFEFGLAIEDDQTGLILAEEAGPGTDIPRGLSMARETWPEIPFICLTNQPEVTQAQRWFALGADDCLSLRGTSVCAAALRRGLKMAELLREKRRCQKRDVATTRLLKAVQELSLARDVLTVQTIVRAAARDLASSDGATFVLRDDDKCYYADEDAIAPLWKGQCFPMSACVSGWVMLNRQPVVIEDIFNDARIPVEAYRPTFVRSLAMVPIRTEAPIGAIGIYWDRRRRALPDEVELIQALANTTSVAMENVRIYSELEQRVKDRTQLLEETNRELESFSFSVSHDLRSPLSAILAYADLLRETLGESAAPDVREACQRIIQQSHRMNGLIRDLLRLGQVSRAELKLQPVDLSQLTREKLQQLAEAEPRRSVRIAIANGLLADADPSLMGVVLDNLLSNAWKYTGKTLEPQIEFGVENTELNGRAFFVRDNGAGFNPRQADRLFAPFQRLHRQDEFPGVGVGLATVQRVIHKHGGRVWAKSVIGEGATFYFTLPLPTPVKPPAMGREITPDLVALNP